MKIYIHVNQRNIVSNHPTLGLVDAVIAYYLLDIYYSEMTDRVDRDGWMNIDVERISNDLPLLKLSANDIRLHLSRLIQEKMFVINDSTACIKSVE